MERAKKLITHANAELKAYDNDSIKMQSRDLDMLGESFMKEIERKKNELVSALKFYQDANEVNHCVR